MTPWTPGQPVALVLVAATVRCCTNDRTTDEDDGASVEAIIPTITTMIACIPSKQTGCLLEVSCRYGVLDLHKDVNHLAPIPPIGGLPQWHQIVVASSKKDRPTLLRRDDESSSMR